MNYDFHFVLKSDLKNNIKKIARQLKKKKSKAIIYIIKIMKPFIERFFLLGYKDERGDYQKITADADMHVIFDKKTYEEIKFITDSMKIFSMAITLRKILEVFIDLVNKIGLENVIRKMKRIRYKHLKNMSNTKSIDKKQNRQLSNCRQAFFNKEYYNITYNKHYDILCIDFFT